MIYLNAQQKTTTQKFKILAAKKKILKENLIFFNRLIRGFFGFFCFVFDFSLFSFSLTNFSFNWHTNLYDIAKCFKILIQFNSIRMLLNGRKHWLILFHHDLIDFVIHFCSMLLLLISKKTKTPNWQSIKDWEQRGKK